MDSSLGVKAWVRPLRRQIAADALDGARLPEGLTQTAMPGARRGRMPEIFARPKSRMGQAIRRVGTARAKAAVTLANTACSMNRLRRLRSRTAFT